MYVELTKIARKEEPEPEIEEQEPQEGEGKEEKGEKGSLSPKPSTSSETSEPMVLSAGRQRYGDTRTMPMFALRQPILIEFMQ
jgi:hypothetical protein